MKRSRRSSFRTRLALGCWLAVAASLCSCGTIVGTAVSPITGGVDLTREFIGNGSSPQRLWAVPFVFLGGVISGPFVAFYNGVNFDPTVFRSFPRYWGEFSDVFRPFEMIRRW